MPLQWLQLCLWWMSDTSLQAPEQQRLAVGSTTALLRRA
jgi:hypothetical protein